MRLKKIMLAIFNWKSDSHLFATVSNTTLLDSMDQIFCPFLLNLENDEYILILLSSDSMFKFAYNSSY